LSAGALAGPASGSQPDREVPDAHHHPVRCPRPGSAGVHEYRAAGAGRIPRGIQRPDPSPGRFVVLGQRAGPAIAQVNDCGSPTARPPGQTTSPGPSCSAGWTSCRCRRGARPPAWPPSGSPPCPASAWLTGAVGTGQHPAVLEATGARKGRLPGTAGGRAVRHPGRAGREPGPGPPAVPIPSARWLRTFGSFRAGRAVPTMMV
jgi:hypothetical protein